MIDLPRSDSLDIGALSALFGHVTNSYKLLFFLALLEKLKDGSPYIDLTELGVEMLVLAWYPHVFFRLSFGAQDRVGAMIDRLSFSRPEPGRIGNLPSALRQAVIDQWRDIGAQDLLRYVPQRLLTPFFTKELRGIPDSQKDKRIRRLAAEHFEYRRPLYRFSDDGQTIQLHPHWYRYLAIHRDIVKGWALWHWVQYLQARNPNVPAIPDKLEPPRQREPLTRQRDFWRAVLERQPLPCLYSGKPLDLESFALDHFIPWSFVCHDRLWNLVPVLPEVNSAKSNRLPEPECFPSFIDHQIQALKVAHAALPPHKWCKAVEDYIVDLRLAPEQLQQPDAVRRAYNNILPPLVTLARQIGFEGSWHCCGRR